MFDLWLDSEDALHVERWLDAPLDLVWRYLTERDLLARWIADGEIEPRVGGVVALSQMRDGLPINTGSVIHGVVTEFVPPNTLAFTWQHKDERVSHVRFALKAADTGTLLIITHTRIALADVHQFAAGWQTHLEFLSAVLAGTNMPVFMTTYTPLVRRYAGLVAARDAFTRIIDAWNRHDAAAMGAPFADHCVMIGFDGSIMTSPADIVASLRAIWSQHHTRPYVAAIRAVRMLNDDSALLHAVSGLVKADGKVNGATNAIVTLLIARDTQDDWRVSLYQNTPAAYHGRPTDAAVLSAELQATADRRLVAEGAVVIQAPARRVWEVLTEPRYIKQWDDVPEGYAGGALELDSVFEWTGHARVTVRELDAPHRLFSELRTAKWDAAVPGGIGYRYHLRGHDGATTLTITVGDFGVLADGRDYYDASVEFVAAAGTTIKALAEGQV